MNSSDSTPVTSVVREMPQDDRPRERLARLGAEALRDAELIAVLFRTGTRETGAIALAERLLQHFNGLRNLARASLEEIQQVKGVGRVKAIELKAALELGKRLATFNHNHKVKIRTAQDIADHLMVEFKEYETEHFKTVLLNTKNEIRRVVHVSHGSVDGTLAMPRDVYRQAVREGATSIIVAHNHPSGDPEPSHADIRLTRKLVEAGELLNIPLLDHIVFGDGRFVSLKERQLM